MSNWRPAGRALARYPTVEPSHPHTIITYYRRERFTLLLRALRRRQHLSAPVRQSHTLSLP